MRITTKAANFRKGFTLVELLITVMILAILAAIMFYSSSEAITTAKATMIISNLKQLSKAANMWYLDNYQRLTLDSSLSNGFRINGKTLNDYLKEHPDEIIKYMNDSGFLINQGGTRYNKKNKDGQYETDEFYASLNGYALYMGHSNIVCYAVYKISSHNDSSEEKKLKEKLKEKAEAEGLKSYTFGDVVNNKSTSKIDKYNGKDANVFMAAFTIIDPN